MSEISVEDQWIKFKDIILNFLNKYFPPKTSKGVLWMTTEIKRLIKKRQRLCKIRKKSEKSKKRAK